MYEFMKRFLDVLFSSVALFILSPLLLCVSILIKLTSPGPVFFSQARVGKGGRIFSFYKFRSMRYIDEAEHNNYLEKLLDRDLGPEKGAPIFKLSSDPRLTWFGKFMRKTSLDELPTLINVLKGDMSLVGPRPALPYEVERYEEWAKERLNCRPGVTGLWQMSGRTSIDYNRMLQLDIEYIHKRSMLLDLKILLKTILIIFQAKGTL